MPRPTSSPYSALKYKNMVIMRPGPFPPTHKLTCRCSGTAWGALTATGEDIMALSLVLMVGAVEKSSWPLLAPNSSWSYKQVRPWERRTCGLVGWGERIPVTVVRVRSLKHPAGLTPGIYHSSLSLKLSPSLAGKSAQFSLHCHLLFLNSIYSCLKNKAVYFETKIHP